MSMLVGLTTWGSEAKRVISSPSAVLRSATVLSGASCAIAGSAAQQAAATATRTAARLPRNRVRMLIRLSPLAQTKNGSVPAPAETPGERETKLQGSSSEVHR